MLIGEAAQSSRLTIQAIRFYERQGLLRPAPRRLSGYREYDDQDLHRLAFIRQAKQLGFSLRDIKYILEIRGCGQCPCSEVTALARHHLQDIQKQIYQLQRFASQLSKAVKSWERSRQQSIPASAVCNLIERMIPEKNKKPVDSIPKSRV